MGATRLKFVDSARGISISLVVLAHSTFEIGREDIINFNLVRIPLFFFVSGLFFRWAMPAKQFFLRKADALLKPYFVVLLCAVVLQALVLGGGVQSLIGVLYGNGATIINGFKPMWFLTHLFAIFTMNYILLSLTNIDSWGLPKQLIVVVLMLIVGSFVIGNVIQLPWGIDILPIGAAFFLAGYFLRDQAKHFSPSLWLFGFALALFVIIDKATGAGININKRLLYYPALSFFASFIGIYTVLCVSYWVSQTRVGDILALLGRSALFILMFHYLVDRVAFLLLDAAFPSAGLISELSAYVCAIALPTLAYSLASKVNAASVLLLPRRFSTSASPRGS